MFIVGVTDLCVVINHLVYIVHRKSHKPAACDLPEGTDFIGGYSLVG